MLYTKSGCLNPILTPVKRPDSDPSDKPVYLELDCGRCIYCRLKSIREKTMRMQMELQSWSDACFVTLTYDNKYLPQRTYCVNDFINNDLGFFEPVFSTVDTLNPRDIKLFMKRLRKALNGKSIKYFCAGEYGPLHGRPHYHMIIYGLGIEYKEIINRAWGLGFITCTPVFPETCKYIAGYVVKKLKGSFEKETAPLDFSLREPEFTRSSHYLGLDYFVKHELSRIDGSHFYIDWKGFKYAIPRTFVRYMTENGYIAKKNLDWYKWQQFIQAKNFYDYLKEIDSDVETYNRQRFQNAKQLQERLLSSRIKNERYM